MIVPHYINGKFLASESQEFYPVFNPATSEILAKTPLGSSGEVDLAVQAAKEAFQTWRTTPAIDRIQPLFQLKYLLESHVDELSKLITQEHGKTLAESRGSVRRAIQMVETATSIPTLMKGENFEDIAKGIDCSSVQRPMGVFAGIAPFNFPAMVPFWFWPFAVACGNTYVLKPSERVPLTAHRIVELLEQTDLPKGVFNLIQGGKTVVDALCQHPDVRGVSFVGSTPVAKHVYTTASATGKRVQALGGAKNLMVAMPDSVQEDMLGKSVATAVDSVLGCAGERCLAGSLILCVGDDAYKVFQQKVKEVASKVVVGDGLAPNSQMGPLISEEAVDRVVGLIDRAEEAGARVLLDGRKGRKGCFLNPTVLSNVGSDMEIAQEEIFGPVVLLNKVKSLDEAISWINSLEYANTTTIFTNHGASARKFIYEVDPSMIGVNIGVPAPMAFFSFGGSKQSFFGDVKAHGKQSIQFFTDTYTTIYRWLPGGEIW